MKKLSILGSTGSIGTQTLDVVRQHPESFEVVALVANSNIQLLEEQIREFKPLFAGVTDLDKYEELKGRVDSSIHLVGGEEALIGAATLSEATMVVTAVVGAVGIRPTVAAIRAGKTIGLANKETLVAGGELIMPLAKEHGVEILPIDSEHSAIFQCLEGQDRNNVEGLVITASGGPLRKWSKEDLIKAMPEDCLKHPTWSMGSKITIDSSTLFNKGLEVIEAHWLFDMDYDAIDVAVHPQSIVHSMIRMKDGALLAQMGTPDMREPIQYVLTYPNRLPLKAKHLEFKELLTLTFEEPRWDDFPALRLAYTVGREGNFYPAIFNAANEIAVYAFLRKEIPFLAIYETVQRTLGAYKERADVTLDNLFQVDQWAREKAQEILKEME